MYGNEVLSRANVSLWHKRFLEGIERLEDNNREGRPISTRTHEMMEKLLAYVVSKF